MKDPIVSVERLSHRYSVQWAVRDINFEIDSTGIVGLLGSNGAGKSTTMNIMCGVLTQTNGDVFIEGRNIKDDTVTAKKCIGFLPQKPPLYLDLTVDEYLTYTAQLRQMKPREIAAALKSVKEKCGITHFSKRLLRNLSGGYQQRVGIAQSIIHNPRFVVMDEPTNGLDPNQILEVRNLIREIAQDKAVLISTHILTEVQAICDRIIMIEQGSVIFDGSVTDFDNYIEPNTFVVSFDHGPQPEALEALAGVTSVKSISEIPGNYRIGFDGDRETIKNVVETSVRNGWELTGIQLEKSSMDEIFAQLSGKNGDR